MIKRSKRYSYLFELVLIVVVLCSCLLFSTIAWLQQTYDLDNKDNQIGRVEAGIYHNGVKVEGTTSTVDGKEVWECKSGRAIEYVYPVDNYGTDKEMNLRMAYFNAIGETPMYLEKFAVPHSWYEEKMKEIGD